MDRLPTLIELDAEKCKRKFKTFVVSAWHIVEPDVKFMGNWHIDAICEYLQALFDDRIPSNNLIINIPPRCMKSILVNIMFPAWCFTKKPSLKFLFYTYADSLAKRDSMKCRNLIGSQWYQERFPLEISKENDQKDQFDNVKGGYRYSFTVGSSAAGQGGDFICLDDPLEISKADSKVTRDGVNFTYDQAISTRGNDPKTVKRIIIMQRLAEDDPVGHILEKEEAWEQLILPMEYDGIRFVSSIGFTDPRTEMGELLWPERFDVQDVKKTKNNLGERGVAGQLQQRPAPLVGGIFKREWFAQRIHNSDVIARYISCDTASSLSNDAAYTSFIVGELMSDYRLFIRFVQRDKYAFPNLISAITNVATTYKVGLKGIIIESKSSGISALQTLAQASEDWIAEILNGYTPVTDKIDRAQKAAIWCNNSSVLLPPPDPMYPWLMDFEDELFNFPNSKYKDQVDSFSQLVLFLEHYLAEGLEARSIQIYRNDTVSLEAVL